MKALSCMSWGQSELCSKKEKHKIERMSGFFAPAIVEAIKSMAEIKALVSEGEKPANHTKAMSVIMRRKKVSFFIPALFPKKRAIEENIERCMPDKARI
jgi:ssDNA-binding Zn-finger/Zn-ribbon topoisomerase 1